MAAIAPASFASELQAEDYTPRSRGARAEIDKKNHNSVIANAASQLRDQSSVKKVAAKSIADDAPETGETEARINGTTAHMPNGELHTEVDGEDGEETEQNGLSKPVSADDGEDEAEEDEEASEPESTDGHAHEDHNDSEDNMSNAESVAAEEWQDASASIAASSIANVATRNNCVSVEFPKFRSQRLILC